MLLDGCLFPNGTQIDEVNSNDFTPLLARENRIRGEAGTARAARERVKTTEQDLVMRARQGKIL
jgi:hypothetical protein